jgi:hypothetical protein
MEAAVLFIIVLGLSVPWRSDCHFPGPVQRPRDRLLLQRFHFLGGAAAVHRVAELYAARDPLLHSGLCLHVDRRRRPAHHPLRDCLRRVRSRRSGDRRRCFACMLFAALSGSSPATVVAIGTIAIAGMRQAATPRNSPPASSPMPARSASSFRRPSSWWSMRRRPTSRSAACSLPASSRGSSPA